jgi:hypothetical protein
VSWLLLLYALATLLGVVLQPANARTATFYPLTLVGLVLGVFGIADWLREVGESMVLAPPSERDEG